MAGDLVRLRNKLLLDQRETFRLVLSPGMEVECIACDAVVEWVQSDMHWKCPECTQELTEPELRVLAKSAHKVLANFVEHHDKRQGRGFLWRFLFS